MRRHAGRVHIVAAAALLSLALACGHDVPTSARQSIKSADGKGPVAVGHRSLHTYDNDQIDLNERLPGFGGMYFDSTGTLHVHLTSAGTAAAVVTQLASYFDAHGAGGRGADVASRAHVEPARYEFRQLAGWRHAFKEFGVPTGVTMLDVDDLTNRFAIGVESEAVEALVWARVDELGIPREAVTIALVGRPELTQALNQYYTPRIAGLQISTNNNTPTDSSCTLGFLGDGPNYPNMYVVTASHCTDARWSMTGDWMGQPIQMDTIGYEVADPPLFDHAADTLCPVVNSVTGLPVRCRYSDAAAILGTYQINPTWHGTIAGTIGSNLTIQDSWTITSTTIVGTGWQVYKVGRTTGTTWGTTRRVCADVWHSKLGAVDVFLLCQGAADFTIGNGDSGAPVFASDPFSTGYGQYRPVMLQGIVWGKAKKTTTTFEPYNWYSYTPYIQDELAPYVGGTLNPIR